MATLIERLMHNAPVSSDHIALHQFMSALRLWVRGIFTKNQLATFYNVSGGDASAQALLNLISNAATEIDKLRQLDKIEDCFMVHEGEQTRPLMPDEASIKTALGI